MSIAAARRRSEGGVGAGVGVDDGVGDTAGSVGPSVRFGVGLAISLNEQPSASVPTVAAAATTNSRRLKGRGTAPSRS
jgi:hypothetical protein